VSYANQYPVEGNISGEETITFPWRPKEVQITNDSGTKELKYKFNVSETFRTLKPLETSTLINVNIRTLIISGNGVGYRVWGLG